MLQQCNVENLRMLASRTMHRSEAWSAKKFGVINFKFAHFNSVFVHIKYSSSNMAARYVNDFMHLMQLSQIGLQK